MKFFSGIGAAVATLMFAGNAFAANLPRKAIAPLVPYYYNWSGFYVGLNVGYGNGTSDWTLPTASFSPSGMTYGATLGYNWQAGALVYGIETDYNASTVNGSATCAVVLTCETSNTWFATFRGRLGYAFDRFLPYLTAGGAYGNIKATLNPLALNASENKFGYAFGAGLEYAFLGNWTAKIEYLYVDLGSFDASFVPLVVNNVSFKENVIRLGINYKFSR